MNPFCAPTTLEHALVRLVPLQPSHKADLIEACSDENLSSLWYTAVPAPQGMAAEITRRQGLNAAGSMNPFAVIATTPGPLAGRAVGMTTYMNIDATNKRLEIGHTWYRPAVQRSGLNTAAKLLLLGHAFDELGCIAVEFRTSWFNQQSRKAIERLGAKLDGVLRNHTKTATGLLRDTCVYSITASEWPSVRAHLTFELQRHAQP